MQGSDWVDDAPTVAEGQAVLAVAEGGDRAIRLLLARPRRVAAIDRHASQLHLLELKHAALKSLAHAEYLELSGQRPSSRRRALFARVRWLLPRETDEFWVSRLDRIDGGIASHGLFERRLASFRHFARLIQGRRKVERFLSLGSEAERRDAYAAEWRTFLWRRFAPALWRRWFDAPVALLERLLFEGRLLVPPPGMSAATFNAAKVLANRLQVIHEPPERYLPSLPPRSIDVLVMGRMDLRGLESELARVTA